MRSFKLFLIATILLITSSLYSQNPNIKDGLIFCASFNKTTPGQSDVEYVSGRTGIDSSAVLFNGDYSYSGEGLVFTHADFPQVTIAAFIRPMGEMKQYLFTSSSSTAPISICIDSVEGELKWGLKIGNSLSVGNVPVDLDVWTFVAVTYNPATEQIMFTVKNDNRSESLNGKAKINLGFSSFVIGGIKDNEDVNFVGAIDQVLIYNRQLSNDEIENIGADITTNYPPELNIEDLVRKVALEKKIIDIARKHPKKKVLPGDAKDITTNAASVCSIEGNIITFSIPAIERADYYVWSLPGGLKCESKESSITAELTRPFREGYVWVRGANKKGWGNPSFKYIVLKKKPVKHESGYSIEGPYETCINDEFYSYKLNYDIKFADSYKWIMPEHCEIIEGQGTKNIKVKFDYHNFRKGELAVVGVNDCGESDTVKKEVKFIGVRKVKDNAKVELTTIDPKGAKISLEGSFEGATYYKWIVSNGLTIKGSSITVKAGTFFTDRLFVQFNAQAAVETVKVWGWSETCGYSKDYLKIIINTKEKESGSDKEIEKEKDKEKGKEEELTKNSPIKPYNKTLTYIDMRFSVPVNVKYTAIEADGNTTVEDRNYIIANLVESTPYYSLPQDVKHNVFSDGNRFRLSYNYKKQIFDDQYQEHNYWIEGELSKDGKTVKNCKVSYSGKNGTPTIYTSVVYSFETGNIPFERVEGGYIRFSIKSGTTDKNFLNNFKYTKTVVNTEEGGYNGKWIDDVIGVRNGENKWNYNFELDFIFVKK